MLSSFFMELFLHWLDIKSNQNLFAVDCLSAVNCLFAVNCLSAVGSGVSVEKSRIGLITAKEKVFGWEV